MKKTLVLILSFLITGSAFASKARLQALGDDKDGSFFIDDFRNIFLNSAYVNRHKDKVFVEWGDNGSNSGAPLNIDTKLDLDNDQKAMGGFLKSAGNLVYGLYLGNESDTDQLLRVSAWNGGPASAGRLNAVDNVTDFFIGGEASGIEWGANVVYSKSEDEANKQEDERYAVRLGMLMGDIEAFANISLGNEASDTDRPGTTSGTGIKFDGSMGFHVGGAYRMGDWTPYVSYKTGEWDNIDGTETIEGSFTEIKVGVGHIHEMSKAGRVYTRLNYFMEEAELKYATSPTSAKLTRVPLTVGYEVDATSWLSLRGSVSTNLMGKRKTENIASLRTGIGDALFAARYNGDATDTGNKDETIQDGTNISAGATLNFGKLSIDGLIGTAGPAGDMSVANSERGTLSLDRLMTRVAMIYSF